MLVASVLLLVEAVLVFISTTKKIINLIMALAVFIASAGCFASYLEFGVLPSLRVQSYVDSLFILSMECFISFLLSLSHYVPYSILLMFSIYFSGYMENKKRWQHALYIFLISIPTLVCFIIFPVGRRFNPDFRFLSIWSGIYIIISLFILLSTYKRALTGTEKNNRFFVIMVILPTEIAHYLIVIVTQAFGNNIIWKYSYIIVAVFFVLYMIFIIRYGIFGLKIKFEKVRFDATIKTINSSTVIFNHAVKNEVSKISLCNNTIKELQKSIESKDIKDKIVLSTEIIEDSLNHMLNLVERIKDNSKPIVLDESEFSLKELIENTVKNHKKLMSGSNIIIRNDIERDYLIKADYTHLRECLGNIINNSIEALESSGEICIYLVKHRNLLELMVQDNGPGILAENLPNLYDPFYTTRKNNANFGLGLFYCYNVMRKHEGNIEVSSIKGTGTMVSLIFPEKRIVSKIRTDSGMKVSFNNSLN